MSEITHLKYSDLMANANEIGACTALGRFLEGGLTQHIEYQSNRTWRESGGHPDHTLKELHELAEELNQRLARLKV